MPGKVAFILGIHNHQPVGNFDHVIEEAFEKAYLPFIEVMKEYPSIPFATPGWAMWAALGLAVGTAVVFAWLPAQQAARLEPIDALGKK